jgi:hypothetical protein
MITRIKLGTCPLCRTPTELFVEDDALLQKIVKWHVGGRKEHIQTALPELSSGQREMFISGIHEACFDALCDDEEEEDEANST